jgi:hypothetical protein
MDVEYEPYFDDEPEMPRAWSLPDHWSPFEPIGNGISCSYCEIAPEIWTWKFRNDGTRKITVMTFRFQDEDGWRDGILPLSLKPGGICAPSAANPCPRHSSAVRLRARGEVLPHHAPGHQSAESGTLTFSKNPPAQLGTKGRV